MADTPTKEQVLTAKELRVVLSQLKKQEKETAESAQSDLKALSKEADIFNKKIKESKNVLNKLGIASSASFKGLITDIDETKKTITDLQKTKFTFDKKIENIKTAMKETAAAIALGGTATKDLQKQFDKLQESTDKLQKEELGAGLKDDFDALVNSLAKLPKDQIAVFSKMFDPSIQTDAKALLTAIEDIGKVKGLDTNITAQLDNIERKAKLMESVESIGSTLFGAKEGKEQEEALQKNIAALEAAQKMSNENLDRGIEKANTKLINQGKILEETTTKFEAIVPSQKVLESTLEGATETIKSWKDGVGQLMARGIPIDKSFLNIEGLRKQLASLTALQLTLASELIAIANKEGTTEEGRKQEVIKLQEKYNKELEKTIKDINDMQNLGDKAIATAETTASEMAGSAQKWSDKLLKAKSVLGTLGKDLPMLKGLFDKLGAVAGGAAKAVGKIAIPLAVFSELGALIKKIAEVQAKVAGMYQELYDTGVFIGTSAETVGKKMTTSLADATNLIGLTKAATGFGSEMALSRDEIVGMVKALDQGGMAARTLESQMKNISTTSAAASNSLLGAANIVKTFSMNLGVSDATMGELMGNMAFEFNTTMGGMKDVFTDITNAAQQSGMSTNKFLGIVQTTTAGVALFEDQIKSTAKTISALGRNTSLSGNQIEDLAKNAQGLSQDMMQSVTAFAMIGKGKMKEMAAPAADRLKTIKEAGTKIQEKIDVILAKGKPSTADKEQLAELKKSLASNQYSATMQGKMVDALNSGSATQAGALVEFADTGTKLELLANLAKKGYDMSAGDALVFRTIATKLGVSSKQQGLLLASGGKITDEIKKSVEESSKGADDGAKTFEDFQKQAIEAQKQTGAAQVKLLQGISDRLNQILGGWGALLQGVLSIVGTLYGIMKIAPLAKSALGYLAELVAPAAETAAAATETVAATEAVVAATAATETAAVGAAGVAGAVGGVALAGTVGAGIGAGLGVGYGLTKLDEKYLGSAVGKAVTGSLGAWLSGQSAAEEGYKKTLKEQGLTDEEISKRLQKIYSSNKVQPVEIEKMPTPTLTEPLSIDATSLAAPTVPAMGPTAATTPAGTAPPALGATTGLKNVIININGGDLDRIRRVVREELMLSQNRVNRGIG